LSDKRPAHAFYEFKTTDTIAAVGSYYEQNRGLLLLILFGRFWLLRSLRHSPFYR